MVEMQIILDTFILLMRRVNLLWGLKQDQRRSSLALKLTKVSEVFNCKHGIDRTAGEKGKRKDAEQVLYIHIFFLSATLVLLLSPMAC